MDDLDRKIFEANQRNIAQNMNFSESQIQELKSIIRAENKEIASIAQRYKDQSDYLAAKSDPSKKNFDKYCEIGAQAIDANPALLSALKQADNKATFMYEVGAREAAFKAQQQAEAKTYAYQAAAKSEPQYQPEQPVQPQANYNFTPEPQQGAAPYSGNIDPASVPWSQLSMSEFEKLSIALGNNII